MSSLRRISDADAFCTYKTAYRIKFPWDRIFEEDILGWLSTFETATNCPVNLIVPATLSLMSALCGPNTKVKSNGNSFKSTLNQNLFAVSDAGGGKSNTYERVILPVVEKIENALGQNIILENYTTAGLQKHQKECAGYGLLTGDEGHRFLASVSLKQSKGEGERALLCKMWTGKGDTSQLSNGSRGFLRTSMSACIFIQPQPFIAELMNFNGEDGLFDRFLIFASKPIFKSTDAMIKSSALLESSPMKDFSSLFLNIFQDHHEIDREYFLQSTGR